MGSIEHDLFERHFHHEATGRPQHKGFASAYDKGACAARDGRPRESPYADKRGGCYGHVITFSRAWTKYWLAGYDSVDPKEEARDAAHD